MAGPSRQTPRRGDNRRRPRESDVITLGASPADSPPRRRQRRATGVANARRERSVVVIDSDDEAADHEVAELTSGADRRRRQEEEDFRLAMQLAQGNEVHNSSLLAGTDVSAVLIFLTRMPSEYNGIPKHQTTPARQPAADAPGPSGLNTANATAAAAGK